MTKHFVTKGSIVRTIWGKADTVLFIFAGAAAEFALNKAVDWLYFTGRLPADPLGRLFSTVTYAREIIFSEEADALRAIDKITAIHQGVENNRGSKIPAWGYRDVLFLLIDYSIRSFELLERKLTEQESTEIFEVFNRVGFRMGLQGLPHSFMEWKQMRNSHLCADLIKSDFTTDLYRRYHRHLGKIRFNILMQVQASLVPQTVREMLALNKKLWFSPVLSAYKLSRLVNLDGLLKSLLLPVAYKSQISKLNIADNP